MFKKWFYNDYTDYYIVEKMNKNVCGETISTYYSIKYKKCRFGIKYYTYWGFYNDYTYTDSSKENLIKNYKQVISSTVTNIIKENICENCINSLNITKSL